MRASSLPYVVASLAGFLALGGGCSAPPGGPSAPVESTASTSSAITGQGIASIALANVGKGACSANSEGGTAFDSSCTGNGGLPEYWCADFARWVWAAAGASNTSELTAAAGSFYVFGQNHGTLHNAPAVGDAVVFDYQGGGVADHVAIVTQVNAGGTIETVSGDWGGVSGSEAEFSSTSHVVLNSPAYPDSVGSAPGIMGMTISGYISPIGLAGADYGASFVSQSFPLASTALHMVAGQILSESITLKNEGAKAWDGNTRLATTQPRDRASDFADDSWISTSRLAGVTGSVPTGGTFTFKFTFRAPSKPGTYLEYFGLVQEGVAWFSDSGQGGPADNVIEAQIVVSAGPAPIAPSAGVKRLLTDPTSFDAWKFYTPDVNADSDANVAAYPDGSPFPAKPVVVVAPSSPAVWVVDGAFRRHVTDPASLAAWELTAVNWTDAQVSALTQGNDWPATPYLVQGSGQPQVYVLDSPEPVTAGPDAGAGSGSGSASGGSSGTANDNGSVPPGGGAPSTPAESHPQGSSGGGCAVSRGPTPPASFYGLFGLGLIALGIRRRRADVARVRSSLTSRVS